MTSLITGVENMSDVTKIRRSHLLRHAPLSGVGLEFGPFNQPTVYKSEMDIRYLDMKTRAELELECEDSRLRSQIQEVDYVVTSNNYTDFVKDRFDLVIANHVGEHSPNFIHWLSQLADLTCDGGYVFIALPDKEFTFDKYRPDSSLTSFLFAFHSGQSEISLERYLECELMYDTAFVGQPLDFYSRFSSDRIIQLLHTPPHIGIHSNVFQSASFIDRILKPVIKLGYANLDLVEFIPARAETGGEMICILKKETPSFSFDPSRFFQPS